MKRYMTLFLAVSMMFSIFTSGCSIEESSNTGSGTSAVVKEGTAKEKASRPSGLNKKTGEVSLVDQSVSKCSALSGMETYNFFTTLVDRRLSRGDIIDFFVKLPISQANKEVYDLYMSDALDVYAKSAPNEVVYGDYFWAMGDSMGIAGLYSGDTNLKMAYTSRMPMDEGPIENSSKTYKVSVAAISAIDSWMGNLYDFTQYEANRHESLELVWMDYGLGSDGCSDTIDMLIAQSVDAILL